MTNIFTPLQMGRVNLANRAVMAPTAPGAGKPGRNTNGFLDGASPWTPSALAPRHHVHRPGGEKLDCVVPRAMTPDGIKAAINDFAQAAHNAIDAGFHGVQIHAASGYLPDQFLRSRTDGSGCPARHRARLMLELAEACANGIGGHRVSIRLSTRNRYDDIDDSDPVRTFSTAAEHFKGVNPHALKWRKACQAISCKWKETRFFP